MKNNYITYRKLFKQSMICMVILIILVYMAPVNSEVLTDGSNELQIQKNNNALNQYDLIRINDAIKLDQTIRIIGAPGSIIEGFILNGGNISLIDSPNSIIRNNQISDVIGGFGCGIYVDNSDNTQIVNNTINNINGDPAFGIYVKRGANILIEGNIIHQISSSSSSAYGIYLSDQGNHRVINNQIETIEGEAVNGIDVESAIDHTDIAHNSIVDLLTGGQACALKYNGYGTVIIEGNIIIQIQGGSTFGIVAIGSEILVLGNYLQDVDAVSANPSVYGIYLGDDSINHIMDNQLLNLSASGVNPSASYAYGIYLVSQTHLESIYENNFIYNLTAVASGDAFSIGFMIEISSGIKINQNHFEMLNAPAEVGLVAEYLSYASQLTSYTFFGDNRANITWTDDELSDRDEYFIYQGSDLIESGAWVDDSWMLSTKLLINTRDLDIGIHSFTIVLTSVGAAPIIDTIQVEILAKSTPSLLFAEDIIIAYGSNGSLIEWLFSDDNPTEYSLYLDDEFILSDSWMSEQAITYSLDNLALGSHNFTVVVYDVDGNTLKSTIFAHIVEGSSPAMTSIDDLVLEVGTTKLLSWFALDDYPGNFTIYLDNETVLEGRWNTSSSIDYLLQDMEIGLYNITIIAYDTNSNYVTDTVWIEVTDTTAPQISVYYLEEYEQELDSYNISWQIFDYNPAFYELLFYDTLIENGTWNNELPLNFSVDFLTFGYYNYTLRVNDTLGNTAIKTIYFLVNDTMAPRITSPKQTSFEEGVVDSILSWYIFDENPGNYSIYLNYYFVSEGTWNTGIPVNYDLSDLKWGLYNITLLVMDKYNNSIALSLKVNIYLPPNHTYTVNTTVSGGSLLENLIDNPYVTGGVAVIAVATVAYMFIKRRA